MDMLEHHLDAGEKDEDGDDVTLGSQDDVDEQAAAMGVAGGAITIDPSVQYQFRAEAGADTVTYRVVQVTQGDDGQTQAVIPYPNGSASPTSDGLGGEPRFTYVPSVANPEPTVESMGQVATAGNNGQFYVMMSPQDVLQAGQRSIAPRTGITPRMEGGRTSRDERRRATHNEVERRRRDKINNWIVQLSKLIPDCSVDINKQGQIVSKGGILAKACDHITDLKTANIRMAESLKETERLSVDAEIMRQQCEELKQENAVLRAQLQQHGIAVPDLSRGGS